MAKRRGVPKVGDKINFDMTPMIDIVFQLLAFFILTFKVVSLEGDFNIKMPQGSSAGPTVTMTVPMEIRLIADANGKIADIRVNEERSFGNSFDEFHRFVISSVGSEGGPTAEGEGQEATIDADYDLKWSETIAAITAISGYVVDDGGKKEVVKLIQNVKFKPPAPGAGG